MGLDDPGESPTLMKCTNADSHDPRLDHWTVIPMDHPEFEHFGKPQVINTISYNIIYCLYHSIMIAGKNRSCPPWPFIVDTRTTFDLGNLSHVATVTKLNVVTTRLPFISLQLQSLSEDQNYLQLLNQLYYRNSNNVQSNKFGVEKDTLTIPLNGLGALAMIGIWNIQSGHHMHKLWQCQSRIPSTASEHISVFNTIPPASPAAAPQVPPVLYSEPLYGIRHSLYPTVGRNTHKNVYDVVMRSNFSEVIGNIPDSSLASEVTSARNQEPRYAEAIRVLARAPPVPKNYLEVLRRETALALTTEHALFLVRSHGIILTIR